MSTRRGQYANHLTDYNGQVIKKREKDEARIGWKVLLLGSREEMMDLSPVQVCVVLVFVSYLELFLVKPL